MAGMHVRIAEAKGMGGLNCQGKIQEETQHIQDEPKQSNNNVQLYSTHAQSITHVMIPWLVCAAA